MISGLEGSYNREKTTKISCQYSFKTTALIGNRTAKGLNKVETFTNTFYARSHDHSDDFLQN